ncbi:ion channel-forming bestrophin family protein, partial [Tremellales sp. Uapishka_1]
MADHGVPLHFDSSTAVVNGIGGEESGAKDKAEKERKRKEDEQKAVAGLIEKKTYTGLVQAFSVAMKHSLRGEKGPFYSDLYSLISFLPKYNPSSLPPIQREHLLVLWQNGIPREEPSSAKDVIAVPLTQPATYTGPTFLPLEDEHGTRPHTEKQRPQDVESNHDGLTTTCDTFREMALANAGEYIVDPDVWVYSKKKKDFVVLPGQKGGRGDKAKVAPIELLPPRHPPSAKIYDFIPPLRIFWIIRDWLATRKMREGNERAKGGKRRLAGIRRSRISPHLGSICPISQLLTPLFHLPSHSSTDHISRGMYLSAYLADLTRRQLLATSFIGPFMTCIQNLSTYISDLDKLSTTPIPSAYVFHLRLTVWGYLFFLPFQLYPLLKWVTIPATVVAAITYLGFLEIGEQIEMPFAYDQSDLDLDRFVLKIAHQLAEVTAFPTSVPSSQIILSNLNQPFLPTLTTSAVDLLQIPKTNRPSPSTGGFAHAYPEPDKDKDTDKDDPKPKDLPKTMRDLELILNNNWLEISSETESYMGKPRDQLENRTGLEIAVLSM